MTTSLKMGGKKAPKKTDEEKAAEAKAKADIALVRACKNDELKSAETAVGKGADVNQSDDNSPMHVAAMYGSLKVIVYLHACGAALDVQNGKKRTPLETAKHVGEDDAATVLEALAAGKSVDLSKLGDDTSDDDSELPSDLPAAAGAPSGGDGAAGSSGSGGDAAVEKVTEGVASISAD